MISPTTGLATYSKHSSCVLEGPKTRSKVKLYAPSSTTCEAGGGSEEGAEEGKMRRRGLFCRGGRADDGREDRPAALFCPSPRFPCQSGCLRIPCHHSEPRSAVAGCGVNAASVGGHSKSERRLDGIWNGRPLGHVAQRRPGPPTAARVLLNTERGTRRVRQRCLSRCQRI